jgi:hypothetical protein
VGFPPSSARSGSLIRVVVPTSQDRYCNGLPERLKVALDHLLYLAGQFVARNEDGDLGSGTATSDVVRIKFEDAPLCSLFSSVAGSPLHRLLGLPQSGRASHQQVPGGRLPLVIVVPEKEPLHDLAQPIRGFLGFEEGGLGGGVSCKNGSRAR